MPPPPDTPLPVVIAGSSACGNTPACGSTFVCFKSDNTDLEVISGRFKGEQYGGLQSLERVNI